MRSVEVIPIVIGCLGTYMPNLPKILKELSGRHLASAYMLRKVLALPEIRLLLLVDLQNCMTTYCTSTCMLWFKCYNNKTLPQEFNFFYFS